MAIKVLLIEDNELQAGKLISQLQKKEFEIILETLSAKSEKEAKEEFTRLEELTSKTDTFDPIPVENDEISAEEAGFMFWYDMEEDTQGST